MNCPICNNRSCECDPNLQEEVVIHNSRVGEIEFFDDELDVICESIDMACDINHEERDDMDGEWREDW